MTLTVTNKPKDDLTATGVKKVRRDEKNIEVPRTFLNPMFFANQPPGILLII